MDKDIHKIQYADLFSKINIKIRKNQKENNSIVEAKNIVEKNEVLEKSIIEKLTSAMEKYEISNKKFNEITKEVMPVIATFKRDIKSSVEQENQTKSKLLQWGAEIFLYSVLTIMLFTILIAAGSFFYLIGLSVNFLKGNVVNFFWENLPWLIVSTLSIIAIKKKDIIFSGLEKILEKLSLINKRRFVKKGLEIITYRERLFHENKKDDNHMFNIFLAKVLIDELDDSKTYEINIGNNKEKFASLISKANSEYNDYISELMLYDESKLIISKLKAQ